MRILTVDDDEIGLEMLNLALREAGHETVSAGDGNAALDVLRGDSCRMVISDWEMPGMNGLDLCRALRAEDTGGYVYIILLTCRDSTFDSIAARGAGVDDFVTKPFNTEELLSRVQTGERILSLESRDVVLFSMARLAESRDPETGHHLERVQSYCGELARVLGRRNLPGYATDAAYVRLICLTSPLHDIGKIAIPDGVLLKPGRLNNREFEIMKNHTTLGAQTLDAALERYPEAKFLQMARDIALTHHERFDGSGYPDGLVGENIPLCGRIVALADVYDALTSTRVYKSAFGHDVARSIITRESPGHFDPVIVECFEEAEETFIEIRERYSETHDKGPTLRALAKVGA